MLLAAINLDRPEKWPPTPQLPPTPQPAACKTPSKRSFWGPGLTSQALRQHLYSEGATGSHSPGPSSEVAAHAPAPPPPSHHQHLEPDPHPPPPRPQTQPYSTPLSHQQKFSMGSRAHLPSPEAAPSTSRCCWQPST